MINQSGYCLPIGKQLMIALNESPENVLRSIPVFQCKPGCFDCCIHDLSSVRICSDGDLVFNGRWHRIAKIGAGSRGYCGRAGTNGCCSYNTRGFLCRLYGVSEMFPDCPHGYGPQKKLSIEETKAIVKYFSYHGLLGNPLII